MMLSSRVEEDSDPDGTWGGPLKTTFLLAMATPMILLPMERIFKPAVKGRHGVADDVDLDASVAERVAEVLGPGRAFAAAPFFEQRVWHFVPLCETFPVGSHWPSERLDELASKDSQVSASKAHAGGILTLLRNALAHGGITYLDRNGRHTESATHMIGFASFAPTSVGRGLQLLRVPVASFETFLIRWADWISTSGVSEQLNVAGPGYVEQAAE
jgi:hypothetical protein